MRDRLTRERLLTLMETLSRSAASDSTYRVYLVGGGTAVYAGWRSSSIDADVFAEQEDIFKDIQDIKERLNINIEISRPEQFVPEIPGSGERHVFLETIGRVSFYHYDPYAQVLSKLVRGFERDIDDARQFVDSGMVDPVKLQALVDEIPESAFTKYPNLTRRAVKSAVESFRQT